LFPDSSGGPVPGVFFAMAGMALTATIAAMSAATISSRIMRLRVPPVVFVVICFFLLLVLGFLSL
jgi:hypothetical protein